ncbi:alkaline phosphatase family protein [Rummeliibacillus sp. SL167]|uniref:alkaline phosphatase family protein n=1 Tax=Rummeliibacillus sp. SL167 TaxID=2579792 RepID=UPI0011B84365|nr:alkaline phosphatase family protein [Rummeliibacillus sp. SL167]
MSNKVIVIVLDALRFDVACTHLGYMQHLVEQKKAARFKVKGQLPALSRPMYETICTGTPPIEHGIVNNFISRASKEKSIFHLAKEHNLVTAAAAYYWLSELYQRTPFQHFNDRIQLHTKGPIDHGIYYFEDHYPDSHVFADAHALCNTFQPDLLYIHSMNIDDDGHKFTANSVQYRNRVLAADGLLALSIPYWLERDYQIIVTADHGMTDDGNHGGNTTADREVPLYIISNSVEAKVYEEELCQLQIAPLICELLQINPSEKMQDLQVPGIY